MSRPGRGSDDGWFHLGRVEVTTTVLVVLLAVVSFVVWALEPAGKPIQNHLTLDNTAIAGGQLWRLLTWPIAMPSPPGIFGVIAIALFWYFGTEIEALLGKKKMAWFLALLTVGLGLLWVAVLAVSGSTTALSTLNQIELMVLLVFIGEYPNRRFFFNIPGWVIGAVIIGYSILVYLGQGSYLLLLNFVLGLVLTAVVARSMGLLAEIRGIPHLAVRRKPRAKKRRRSAAGPTVVQGPWQPPETTPVSRDQAELDALLDKIHAHGMDSLSDQEREQLLVLRDRLRRR
jgi:hypothetical protein